MSSGRSASSPSTVSSSVSTVHPIPDHTICGISVTRQTRPQTVQRTAALPTQTPLQRLWSADRERSSARTGVGERLDPGFLLARRSAVSGLTPRFPRINWLSRTFGMCNGPDRLQETPGGRRQFRRVSPRSTRRHCGGNHRPNCPDRPERRRRAHQRLARSGTLEGVARQTGVHDRRAAPDPEKARSVAADRPANCSNGSRHAPFQSGD